MDDHGGLSTRTSCATPTRDPAAPCSVRAGQARGRRPAALGRGRGRYARRAPLHRAQHRCPAGPTWVGPVTVGRHVPARAGLATPSAGRSMVAPDQRQASRSARRGADGGYRRRRRRRPDDTYTPAGRCSASWPSRPGNQAAESAEARNGMTIGDPGRRVSARSTVVHASPAG